MAGQECERTRALRLFSFGQAKRRRADRARHGGQHRRLLLQVLVSGLAAGAVYGLVAIAYVLVYRLTGVVYGDDATLHGARWEAWMAATFPSPPATLA